MKSTTRFSKNIRGLKCLNCEQPISDKDNFCSNCGQVNDELPLSIKQFISEFFSGFFNFDTRFLKTFVPLLLKPGVVPKDYIEGKRMRYVNPFQLYLHVTIIFFLLQGLFSALDEYKIPEASLKNESAVATDSIGKDITVDLSSVTTHDSENNKLKDTLLEKYNVPYIRTVENDSLSKNIKQKIKYRIDSIIKVSNILQQLKSDSLSIEKKDSIFLNFHDSNMKFISNLLDPNNTKNSQEINNISKYEKYSTNYSEEILKSQGVGYTISEKAKMPVDENFLKNIVGNSNYKKMVQFIKYDKAHQEIAIDQALDDLGYEKTRWNIFYYKKAQDINKLKRDVDFKEQYIDSVISKISLALFFLLPVFTLFISLLYIRGTKNYTEHLVYVFNMQTVFFLLLIFFTIFDRIFTTDFGTIIFVPIFLFYLYKALRNFYKQNRFKTILKYLMLNAFFVILSGIGLIIISFIAFAI